MMGFNSNIDKLIERFKILRDQARSVDFSEALVGGVTAARGAMENRIFNQGKNSEGGSLGEYLGKKAHGGKDLSDFVVGPLKRSITPYEKKRVNKGRQIRYKDLEFTGDLRRGIVVIRENETSVVCAIPNDVQFKIAKYQEEFLKVKIFRPTEQEKELLREQVILLVNQIYARLLNPSGTI